ncbi:uncharacterized protein LOC107272671 [Cephus cinctus]|uniref:Uncharacterized protein LOC107272671 n=1 Tax=Cephus cinctus TaxID=211228 RepID=A0AAJ7FS41_CEPCN|nr:uncharacterized protein LOC107272671 [Cephus cinctus]XP_015605547.1 uncharacterized protein LOC107272671 [Cephus cinctus]
MPRSGESPHATAIFTSCNSRVQGRIRRRTRPGMHYRHLLATSQCVSESLPVFPQFRSTQCWNDSIPDILCDHYFRNVPVNIPTIQFHPDTSYHVTARMNVGTRCHPIAQPISGDTEKSSVRENSVKFWNIIRYKGTEFTRRRVTCV